MGIALSGLASGFDWKSIVDQLVEVSRAPQTRMRKEQSTNSQKSSALDDVRGKLAALKTSIANLNSQDSLLKKSATIADKTSNWTATATKDTPAGDYNVEMISQPTATLLRGRQNIGKVIDTSKPIGQTYVGTTITQGKFTINGYQVDVDPSETWNQLIARIEALGPTPPLANSPNPPIFTVSKTGDNLTNDRFSIISNNGPIVLGSAADTTNFLQATRLFSNGSSIVTTDTSTDSTTGNNKNGLGVVNLSVSPFHPSSNLTFNINRISVPSSFKINGSLINISANASTQDILDAISASPTAGVFASYDRKLDQVLLQNKKPGNFGIQITEDLGNVALALGLTGENDPNQGSYVDYPTQVSGQNAAFRINGGGIFQAQSSTLSETDHGIKGLTINANSLSSPNGSFSRAINMSSQNVANTTLLGLAPLVPPSSISKGALVSGAGIPAGTTVLDFAPNGAIWNGSDYIQLSSLASSTLSSGTPITFTNSYTPTKITVAGDSSAAKEALNDFVAKYNSVQDTIERYTKVTTSGSKVTSSILSGNRELSDIARKLRTELYTSSGLTGTVNRLSDLGVTSSGIQNTVSFNSSVLEAKLASSSDDVSAFFKDAGTSAFMTRVKTNFLDKLVTDAGSATGGLQAQLTSFTKQNTSLDKQIADVERRLASQRATLEASFIAMERAQSKFQQQGAYLAKTYSN